MYNPPPTSSKTQLTPIPTECRFQLGPTPHVVHMTIKPQSFIDEEEAHKGGGREREAERSPRCRCCVM